MAGERIACSPRRLPPVRALAASRSDSHEERRALARRKRKICAYPSIPKKSLAQSLSTRTLGSADCTRFAARCPYRRFLSISQYISVRALRVRTVADCCATPRERRTTEQDLRNVNDPSAGSPTETLLRLLLPLNDQVWSSSRQHRQCRDIAAHQSEDLTKSFNR